MNNNKKGEKDQMGTNGAKRGVESQTEEKWREVSELIFWNVKKRAPGEANAENNNENIYILNVK